MGMLNLPVESPFWLQTFMVIGGSGVTVTWAHSASLHGQQILLMRVCSSAEFAMMKLNIWCKRNALTPKSVSQKD